MEGPRVVLNDAAHAGFGVGHGTPAEVTQEARRASRFTVRPALVDGAFVAFRSAPIRGGVPF